MREEYFAENYYAAHTAAAQRHEYAESEHNRIAAGLEHHAGQIAHTDPRGAQAALHAAQAHRVTANAHGGAAWNHRGHNFRRSIVDEFVA